MLSLKKYGLGIKKVFPDAVSYVSKFTRNPLPEKIVWDLGTRAEARTVDSFYWLEADMSVNEGIIKASIDKQTNTIRIEPENVNGDFSILVSPYMLDISKPIRITTPNGELSTSIDISKEKMEDYLIESLIYRGDPNYVYVGKILCLRWKN